MATAAIIQRKKETVMYHYPCPDGAFSALAAHIYFTFVSSSIPPPLFFLNTVYSPIKVSQSCITYRYTFTLAVGISRLGGSSAFIGKVGEDEFGYMLADILKENNVNNEGMRFDPSARTALDFVTLKKDGEREFMFYRNPSVDMILQESELDLELIRKAKIFHYGSISLITEPCKSAHISATKAAKDIGVLLSYDPNLRLPLWPSVESAREGILSIWDTTDIIKISEEEIEFMTNGEDPFQHYRLPKLS